MLSFNMPSIFGAYFSTGDFKAVILVAVLIVIDMLLYFPFMKMYEKQQLLIEQQDEMQEEPCLRFNQRIQNGLLQRLWEM